MARLKSSSSKTLHVLSVSAAVTHVKWRPPAENVDEDDDDYDDDWHDSMLAVASARLTSAGGSGVLGLWSCQRPFMPLSVVEGHKEGAIGDFVWLETPQAEGQSRSNAATNNAADSNGNPRMRRRTSLSGNSNDETILIRGSARGESESILFDNKDSEMDVKKRGSPRIWQHALSVGRDGRCLLQSFTRGESIECFYANLREILNFQPCHASQLQETNLFREFLLLVLQWPTCPPFKAATARSNCAVSTKTYPEGLKTMLS